MFQPNVVTDDEFHLFQKFIYDAVGINLSSQKKPLVTARLCKRLRHYRLPNFRDYFSLVEKDITNNERQILIDLLTTNETFFFREKKHFDFLESVVNSGKGQWDEFSIWSAAASSGEEAYSLAMTMASIAGNKAWKVVGSDVSTRMIDKASRGQYLMERIEGIPDKFLCKYCLKGTGKHQGTLLVDDFIRSRVTFVFHNLLHTATNIGKFNMIFLRNVLIYFDEKTKKKVVSHMTKQLLPKGYLIVGHADKFDMEGIKLEQVKPSIYQRAD